MLLKGFLILTNVTIPFKILCVLRSYKTACPLASFLNVFALY